MEKIINISISLIFIICFLNFQSSCSSKERKVLDGKYRLTSNDVNEVLSLIEPKKSQKSNFHILYSEFFNDSTFVVQIWQHGQLASKNNLVSEIFEYERSKVFIYDDIQMVNNNQKDMDRSPFFIVDANYWSVLVKRRNQENQYFKVEIFSNYSDSLELEEDLDIY
jgi:hypothetical protein